MSSKINLCVLFGGSSSEYEVSCMSAASVIQNLDPDKYNITPIGITYQGEWCLYTGDVSNISNNTWYKPQWITPAIISPDSNTRGIIVLDGKKRVIPIDVAFGVLHGRFGEDGALQGLFELAKIQYCGCGVCSSAIAMDKSFAKMIMDKIGIKMAKWTMLKKYEYDNNADKLVAEIECKFTYPVYIKPANAGSSVGISKAHNREELLKAFDLAFANDSKIIIEENIKGREIEISVLGNKGDIITSPCGEIIAGNEFYDYAAKYGDCGSKTIVPANISSAASKKISETAVKIFKILDGRGFSRVDFFLTQDEQVIFNEINTIPGFTSISMFAKMFEAGGVSFSELLDKIIILALEV